MRVSLNVVGFVELLKENSFFGKKYISEIHFERIHYTQWSAFFANIGPPTSKRIRSKDNDSDGVHGLWSVPAIKEMISERG